MLPPYLGLTGPNSSGKGEIAAYLQSRHGYVGVSLSDVLRDEAKQRLGAKFDLFEFHSALLASGTIPPSLIREELWDRLGVA